MLKEITKKNWLRMLGIPKMRIPKVLILRGTRNLKTNYAKYKKYFSNIHEIGSPNGIFEDLLIGRYKSVDVAYASIYGDAMASEITHVFGVLGTPQVIQTGCCGALSRGIMPGDLICPTEAFCGEGAAQYYLSKADIITSSKSMVSRMRIKNKSRVKIHKGPIYTTSALLAEGKDDIERWSKQGYIAVDMETATVFAVAEYFKMKHLSVLFTFDNPLIGESIVLTDNEKQERRNLGEKCMLRSVFSLIESL